MAQEANWRPAKKYLCRAPMSRNRQAKTKNLLSYLFEVLPSIEKRNLTSLLERRRQESIIETTVMESSEKVIPNVKMDLGFLRLKIRTSCFSFSQAPGTSVKRRESREMKKGISYMFVSPKGSERKTRWFALPRQFPP
ncbi:MAG: hypothetical protein PWQ24_1618 [Mesotoga sp.]|nr:hypothetical protein [Mesotoga sp.]